MSKDRVWSEGLKNQEWLRENRSKEEVMCLACDGCYPGLPLWHGLDECYSGWSIKMHGQVKTDPFYPLRQLADKGHWNKKIAALQHK